jgi:hypothetical protein
MTKDNVQSIFTTKVNLELQTLNLELLILFRGNF